ncbi:MAG TPA: hypothetical protein VMD99_02650 [Terriglobales bacterium]|nr:hypothetical protein [Terriglobales bacterium]
MNLLAPGSFGRYESGHVVSNLPVVLERGPIQRLIRRITGTEETTGNDHGDAVVAALLARLASLEKEIARLTCLASKEQDAIRQEGYWSLARDLQREAREIRKKLC